jgi:hypothetical protein
VQKIQHSGGPLYAKSLVHIGFRSSMHIRNPNIQVQVSKFPLDGEFHGILSQVSIGKKKAVTTAWRYLLSWTYFCRNYTAQSALLITGPVDRSGGALGFE